MASAVALKNLETIERLGLVPRVRDSIGPYLQRRMRETFADHPLVGEVRGRGLLCAIELVADKKERSFYPDPGTVGTHCRNYCFSSGLIMRAIRDTMVCAPRPSSSPSQWTNSSPMRRTRLTARRRITGRCEGVGASAP